MSILHRHRHAISFTFTLEPLRIYQVKQSQLLRCVNMCRIPVTAWKQLPRFIAVPRLKIREWHSVHPRPSHPTQQTNTENLAVMLPKPLLTAVWARNRLLWMLSHRYLGEYYCFQERKCSRRSIHQNTRTFRGNYTLYGKRRHGNGATFVFCDTILIFHVCLYTHVQVIKLVNNISNCIYVF